MLRIEKELQIRSRALPPYGWKKYEQEKETLFIGYEFRVSWTMFALFSDLFFFGYPTIVTSLFALTLIVGVSSIASLLHGYRVLISDRGIEFSWTYCGVAYKCMKLPLTSIIRTEGGFGTPDDRVVIGISSLSGEVVIVLNDKSVPLSQELKKEQNRWQVIRSAVQ